MFVPSPVKHHHTDRKHPLHDTRAARLGSEGKLSVVVDNREMNMGLVFAFDVDNGYVKRYLHPGERALVDGPKAGGRPFARVKGTVRVYEEVNAGY